MFLLTFFIALLSSYLLHPTTVEVAKLKGITDNPGRRKLQREPVPVLGGIVVFFGVLMGIGFTTWGIEYHDFSLYIALMFLMLVTGTLDDITDLSTRIRFLIEIGVSVALVFLGGLSVNNFHGLWGLWQIDFWVALVLTIVTVVGIINAINLVDGVDGLSSGYCIMSTVVFGSYLYVTSNMALSSLCFASAGALVPFFVHNVFGKKQKMFIGDGGTLLMGIILSINVLSILCCDKSGVLTMTDNNRGVFGLVPFTLAVLSFPICDTLRVMIWRIIRGESPFSPDKTHLHHAFIGIGFSHLKTTASILSLNLFIILLWYILWQTGCSVDCQFYVVVGTTLFLNLTIYHCCTIKAPKD